MQDKSYKTQLERAGKNTREAAWLYTGWKNQGGTYNHNRRENTKTGNNQSMEITNMKRGRKPFKNKTKIRKFVSLFPIFYPSLFGILWFIFGNGVRKGHNHAKNKSQRWDQTWKLQVYAVGCNHWATKVLPWGFAEHAGFVSLYPCANACKCFYFLLN